MDAIRALADKILQDYPDGQSADELVERIRSRRRDLTVTAVDIDLALRSDGRFALAGVEGRRRWTRVPDPSGVTTVRQAPAGSSSGSAWLVVTERISGLPESCGIPCAVSLRSKRILHLERTTSGVDQVVVTKPDGAVEMLRPGDVPDFYRAAIDALRRPSKVELTIEQVRAIHELLGHGGGEAAHAAAEPVRIAALSPHDPVRVQVGRWRDELMNLSRRDRLLYFADRPTNTLHLVTPSQQEILDGLAGPGLRFWAPIGRDGVARPPRARDEIETTVQEFATVERVLRNLDRRAREEWLDKGLQILYLAFGLLSWVDPERGDTVRSPVVLVPVSLGRASPREPFRLQSADADPVVNPALRLKLERDFGVALPRLDADALDLDTTLLEAAEAIDGREGWSVDDAALISLFSFAKEPMYRDLETNEERIAGHRHVRALVLPPQGASWGDLPPEQAIDEAAPPETLHSILDADSTQRRAVEAARRGMSFVMDGPPGTGKSQTIANVIAEVLAQQKTVLFVSEKAAALDVVRNRLADRGLGEFILELHSQKATRREFARTLAGSLLNRAIPQVPDFETADSVALRRRRFELEAYVRMLHEPREPLGQSLYDAIGRVVELQTYPQAPGPDSIDEHLQAEQFDEIRRQAQALGRHWTPVERGAEFVWRDVQPWALEPSRRAEITEAVAEAQRAISAIADAAKTVAADIDLPHHGTSMNGARVLLGITRLVAQLSAAVPPTWLTVDSLDPLWSRCRDARGATLLHRQLRAAYSAAVGDVPIVASATARTSLATLRTLKSREINLVRDETSDSLRATSRGLIELAAQADSALARAVELATALGISLDSEAIDERTAIALGEFAGEIGRGVRSPAAWLAEQTAHEAERATAELLELAIEERACRGAVADRLDRRRRDLAEQLASLLGSAWRDVDPSTADRLREDAAVLVSARPPLHLDKAVSIEDTRTLARFVDLLGATAARVIDDALGVADIFGLALDRGSVTLEDAERLAALAHLSNEPVRPPRAWFHPTTSATASAAVDALAPLLDAEAAAREVAERTFTEAALEVDIGSLHDRFVLHHTGLRKLGGAYRADKATLRTFTRSGRAGRPEIDALPDAIAWQKARESVMERLARCVGVLGDLDRGVNTDVATLRHLIAIAQTALRLAGPEAEPSDIARQLAAEELPTARLSTLAERLEQDLRGVVEEGPSLLPVTFAGLRRSSLSDIVEWSDVVRRPLGSIIDAWGRVSLQRDAGQAIRELATAAARRRGVAELTDAVAQGEIAALLPLRAGDPPRRTGAAWWDDADSSEPRPADFAEMRAWRDAYDRLAASRQNAAAILGELDEGDSTRYEELVEKARLARTTRPFAERWPHDRQLLALVEGSLDRGAVADAAREVSALATYDRAGRLTALNMPAVLVRDATRAPLAVLSSTLVETAVDLSNVADGADETCDGRGLMRVAKAAWETRLQMSEIEDAFTANRTADEEAFGERWSELRTDFEDVERALEAASGIRSLLDGAATADAALAIATFPEAADIASRLESEIRAAELAVEHALRPFLAQRASELTAEIEASFADAKAILVRLVGSVQDVSEWREFAEARDALEKAGCGTVLRHCERRPVQADDVAPTIERAVLERWVDATLGRTRDELGPIWGLDHAAAVEEFASLDRRWVDHAPGLVAFACNDLRPVEVIGAFAKIQREGEKQRRHIPIRDLLAETKGAAMRLRPCFMMSPLAVSQFLPADVEFDVVIFDEASQITPADSINCIARGRQVVIAGDQRQLPPTRFWDIAGEPDDTDDDDDNADDLLNTRDFESILDVFKASASLPSLPLRWHYRSAHEDLIAFSNRQFYSGSLFSFPGARSDSGEYGVEFVHVPSGVYDRGRTRTNREEARVVAERAIHHLARKPAVSVGVVAFSSTQAAAVEDAIEEIRRLRPDLDARFVDDRLAGFFVKSIENVQGDERDVILFSVGYARDASGRMTQNFGPLGQPGGERRLNVAVTRARRKVEVVASIRAADVTESANPGRQALRAYLEHAERGQAVEASEGGRHDPGNPTAFERELARVIESRGFEAHLRVGSGASRVDVGVRHAEIVDRYVLGVLTDGPMHRAIDGARDRERLRETVLARLGWRVVRVNAAAWYRNRKLEVDRLALALDEALEAAKAGEEPSVMAGSAVITDIAEEPEAPPNTWLQPYVLHLPAVTTPFDIHEPEARADVRQAIVAIVQREGPIHVELLTQRLRQAWPSRPARAGARIQATVGQAIKHLADRGLVVQQSDFVGTSEQMKRPDVRVPTDDDRTRRVVGHVHRFELVRAVANVVERGQHMSEMDITMHVARLYGWDRVGPDIRESLSRSIAHAVSVKLVQRDGDDRYSPSMP